MDFASILTWETLYFHVSELKWIQSVTNYNLYLQTKPTLVTSLFSAPSVRVRIHISRC